MPIIDPGTMPSQLQAQFDDKLLSVRTPSLIHTIAGTAKKLKSKGSDTLRMSRYNRLPTFKVQLPINGAQIPSTPATRVDIDAKMGYYGLAY